MVRAVSALVLGGLLAPGALAGNQAMLELLRVLRDRGSITQAEYEMVRAAAEAEEGEVAGSGAHPADAARTDSAVAAATPAPEPDAKPAADLPRIDTRGKLQITSADGRHGYRIGGRLMHDATWWDDDGGDVPWESGQEFRRARLFVSGEIDGVWDWKFQFDFTDLDDEPQAGIEDAYVRYTGFEDTAVTLGQVKAPFSMEELTSSKYMTFIERSLVTDATSSIVGNRRPGLHLTRTLGDAFTLSGAFTGNRVSDSHDFDGEYAFTGRGTWSPVHEADRAIHLGLAAGWRKLDQGLRVRARPEVHLAGRPVDNDFVPADDVQVIGLDGAWVSGPLSLQGEYVRYDLDETVAGSGDGAGWFVAGSWFLTGESRNYDRVSGDFGSTKVSGPVGAGGPGAWELAARFSTLDLDDSASLGLGGDGGGEIDNLTLGLNWYLNNNMMFRLNYVRTLDCSGTCEEGLGSPTRAEPSAITLRSQVFF
jgi:phosphate-selective porin OprO/OprP